ncbi:hypothetical protein CLV24_105181 [Pontibacter ummariensis]|uniref:Uncharacterized protein n=1 Tax=Pontibacter ummariensis TaxID=1610492 RepID=A0A239DRI8_9BACT|nr:hypothetical protein [Pontibacter ummariensis]PRY13811.1 hypothetical protein CLV24_105181 [Pontibacter ummariensis]SNS34528.1 hypothetical protein SAMN06296052_10571 [Pontibacter ummariensis]
MEQPTPSPDIKQPFYRLATNRGAAESTFDSRPLLQLLTEEITPLEMARTLDQVYTLLSEYLVSDAHTSGMHYAGLLSDLRRMRDALLQGSGQFDTRK